jgi:SAM-dependent methyltransferase
MTENQSTERLQTVKRVFETPQWYLKGRSYHVRVRTNTVQHLLPASEGRQILDIGCGDGSISVPLLRPGSKLTLLDMSAAMLKIAQSRVPAELASAVTVINGDVLGADLPPAAYDVVICLGVFAYFSNPAPLIEKLHTILRPGGTLIVECSDSAHFLSSLVRVYDRLRALAVKPEYRTNAHAATTLVNGLKTAGFKLLGSYRYAAPNRLSRKLFPQSFHFWKIRTLFGDAARPRSQGLGNECIFWFSKPAERPGTARNSSVLPAELAEASGGHSKAQI